MEVKQSVLFESHRVGRQCRIGSLVLLLLAVGFWSEGVRKGVSHCIVQPILANSMTDTFITPSPLFGINVDLPC